MLDQISPRGKALILAYDHGMEHGPVDFNDKNVDPNNVLDIALKCKYNAIALQKGIVLKYYKDNYKNIPLVMKLNGKTNLVKGDPYSTQICTVKRAQKLGAKAVGFTIYPGSEHEAKMFKMFSKVEREAHERNLGVIAWMYPRGKNVKDELESEILAYSARLGLEMGADIIKLKYNGKPEDLKWITKCAGKTKIYIAGGMKTNEAAFLKQVEEVMEAGAKGIVVGRNVWQQKDPVEFTKKIKSIIF